NHVVEQATKVQVQLNGGATPYTPQGIGTDGENHLAGLKNEGKHQPPTNKTCNSDGGRGGDWGGAMLNTFCLGASGPAGIISSKDRGIGRRQFQRFLQTDAAINPGNSGGPLVDMAGQVIGINTAIVTGSRGYEGVGFALPSNTAVNVYNQLITSGKVTRGSIGVTFTEEHSSNPVVLRELGVQHGIVIEGVEANSPAGRAGLKPGDVITAVNGKPVKTGNDLVNPIAQSPIGGKVRITYMRDRKEQEATLTVEDRTKIFPDIAGRNSEQPSEATPVEFGLRVEELTPDRARRVGLEGQRGVMVTEVEPASFADDVGRARGDLIVEINRESVVTASDYRRAISKLKPGQDVVFKVLRRADSERTLTVFLAGVVPVQQQ